MPHEIAEVNATDTHGLRRAVLRKDVASTDVVFPEDDMDGAFHLAALSDDDVCAVASFSPSPTPFRPDATAWQLRGMAVADHRQRQGLGEALLRHAIDRVRAVGAEVLWCNARDSAQGFYARLGFVVEGDGFVTKTTGLPHHVMVLDL
jgi:GNAT superfamily N-acetyltransferase